MVGLSMQGQGLDSMILVGPLQRWIAHDSMISTSVLHFKAVFSSSDFLLLQRLATNLSCDLKGSLGDLSSSGDSSDLHPQGITALLRTTNPN